MSDRCRFIFFIILGYCLFTATVNSQQLKVQEVQAGFSANLFYEVDSRDAQVALEIWVKEVFNDLENKDGIILKPNVMIYEDLALLKSAIEKDKLDFLILSILDYLELKDQIAFDPILMGAFKGVVGEENVLLVHQDLEGEGLESLKNRRLMVYPGHRGEISKTWLSTLLLQQGDCASEQYFSEIRLAKNPTQAVLQVFFHQADACVVHYYAYETMAELNPQLKTQLKVLKKSPIFAYGVNLLTRKFEPALKETVTQVALEIGTLIRGQQILRLFGMDQIVRFEPAHIASVEMLIKNYNDLITGNCPGQKIRMLPRSKMNSNFINSTTPIKKEKTALEK